MWCLGCGVVRFFDVFFMHVKFFGFVKLLLNALAMSLSELIILLLNIIEWLGSVVVGRLFFMVFPFFFFFLKECGKTRTH